MLAPVGELAFGEPELLRMTLAAPSSTRTSSPSWRRRAGSRRGYERVGALHVALDRDEAASCAACTSCSARSGSAPSGCRRAAAASWSRA
jgi:hypothetical protein